MQRRFAHRWFPGLRLLQVCVAVCAWAGTAAAAPTGSAWSADLPAISDGRHLWTWAQTVDPKNDDAPQLSLFHADLTHRPPEGPVWEAAGKLTGRVAARGVAADDHTLYLIFDDGSTQVVSLRPAPAEGHWYFSKRTAPRLPQGVSVRAVAAGHGKLWVLVRIESAESMGQIDQPSGPGSAAGSSGRDSEFDLFDLILGYPENRSNSPKEKSESTEETEGGEAEAAETDESSPAPDTADAPPEESAEAVEQQGGGDPGVVEYDPAGNVEQSEPPAPEPEPGEEAAVDEVPEIELPTERLLVLDRGAWRKVALPGDWPHKLPTQLIAPAHEGERPTLMIRVPSTTGETGVRVFRPAEDDTWAAVDLRLPPIEADATAEAFTAREDGPMYPGKGGVVGLRAGEQLLLVQALPTEGDGFAASVAAVRGAKLLPVAVHRPNGEQKATDTTGQWTAVPAGGGVALLAGPRGLSDRLSAQLDKFDESTQVTGPALTVLDLHGQTVLPSASMKFEPADPIAEAADMVIFLSVLFTSTVLLFTFWRRVPTANQLQLPEGIVLADTLRRLFAGLIDLTPGMLVGTLLFGLTWEELYTRWPGRGQGMTFALMIPGLTAIGVIVGHTALLEIATGGRSLGKLLTGLRVTTLEGDTPRPWQSLVRCLLKAFDLIAYLLLILPLISPHRQRLGDMVARTVVTMSAPPAQDPESKDRA